MNTYPINLIGLENRKIVVAGGGAVAARKIDGLIDSGARVLVISPEVCERIREQALTGKVAILQRSFQPGDLLDAFLAIAATDDPDVNQAVWEEALSCGCLVNVVDDPQHCTFILPAVVRRGDLTIAISTGGTSPALARRLREKIEPLIEPEYAELAAILGELRPELMEHFLPGAERLEAALRLIDSELLQVIKVEGSTAAMQYARKILTSPDLITKNHEDE